MFSPKTFAIGYIGLYNLAYSFVSSVYTISLWRDLANPKFISPDATPNAYIYSLIFFPNPEFRLNNYASGFLVVLFAG